MKPMPYERADVLEQAVLPLDIGMPLHEEIEFHDSPFCSG
jgi:hypothetical protein